MGSSGEAPGGWARWAGIAVAAYLALFVWLVQRPTFHGLFFPDPAKYSDMARHLTQGRGLITNFLSPRNLAETRYTERVPPVLLLGGEARYVGYPLALAGAFRLFGARDETTFAVAAFFWVLGGWLVYVLGRLLFSVRVGVLAAVLYSLQAKTSALAVAAGADTLCIALTLGVGALALARRAADPAAVAAGALTAFAMVVRQQMAFVAPLCLVGFLAMRDDRRARAAALAALGFAACWLARGPFYAACFPPRPPLPATPIAAAPAAAEPAATRLSAPERLLHRFLGVGPLTFSARFPGHALDRSLADPYAGETTLTAELLGKAKINAWLLAQTLLWKTGAPLWMAAFLAAAWATRADRRARRLTWLLALLLGATGATCLTMYVMTRYFQLFVPLMALLVAGGLDRLAGAAQRAFPVARGAAAAALTVAISLPLPFGHLLRWLPAEPELAELAVDLRPDLEAIAGLARDHTPPNEAMFTDLPWVVAWRADRPVVWLPLEPRDVYELARRVKVDYLLLTFQEPQGFAEWRDWLLAKQDGRLHAPEDLADWTFVAGAPSGGRVVYLFRREPGPAPAAEGP